MKKKHQGNCPVCGLEYCESNPCTRHHVFPRQFYGNTNAICIPVCNECHKEFHHRNPMKTEVWTRLACIGRWIEFCSSRGKKGFAIYPILKQISNYEQSRESADRTCSIYLGRAVGGEKTQRKILVLRKRK